jgi:dTDP-glucose pyrophosphorylase
MTQLPPVSAEPWRRVLVPEDATVQDAIRSLDATGLQIVIVVAPDGVLRGTVTDGDVRRGVLRGAALTSPVAAVLHRDPLVVPPQLGREAVLQLMQANKVRQMPVVDQDGRVVGLHLWDQLTLPVQRPNIMVLMAGGRGTRLRPHTEQCPKPLVPVAGRPMLEHIIERAKLSGFRRFVVALHFLGHMIEDYFGDGTKWGVEIRYVHEESPLGTAGALRLLDPRPDVPFLVSNGDVLADVRYSEVLDFHEQHGAAGTMAVRVHEWQHPFGVVRTNGVDIVSFEEKPVSRTHINAGIYALNPEAIDLLAPGEACDMPTLFTRIQQQARTIVYPMHEPWLDVGQADDLARAQSRYSQGT